MSRGPSTFPQWDVTAAVEAVVVAGVDVARVEVGSDGNRQMQTEEFEGQGLRHKEVVRAAAQSMLDRFGADDIRLMTETFDILKVGAREALDVIRRLGSTE